jgi:hypothetical protein
VTAQAGHAVSACKRRHLPHWIQEELWEVELDGDVEARRHKLRARRGRLLRRVEGWRPTTAVAFARDCADQTLRIAGDAAGRPTDAVGMAADAQRRARVAESAADPRVAAHGGAVCAYIAAMAALRTGGVPAHDAERARQVAWLTGELALRP